MNFENNKINNFFIKKKDYLDKSDIINLIDCLNVNKIPEDIKINNLLPLELAEQDDLTFLSKSIISGDKYVEYLKNTEASYCLIEKENLFLLSEKIIPIIVENPYIAFIKLCENFFVLNNIAIDRKSNISNSANISKFSHIASGVNIEDNVQIACNVSIGNGVVIKSGVTIHAGVVIGDNCIIGNNSEIHSNVTIQFTEIGNNCNIKSGASIGQDGFGFVFDKKNMIQCKIPHFGFVKIGNFVEIGSNACIDKGVLNGTIIADYVKIDNLVQIAHNVKIGYGTVIAGMSAVAGSTEIGKLCMVGGGVLIVGHVKIGDFVKICGGTSVSKSIANNSTILSGWPGENAKTWAKKLAVFNRIVGK